MEIPSLPIHADKRIHVADALRGLALCIIFLFHFQVHFMSNIYGPNESVFWKGIEESVLALFYFLLEGKVYSIFAILFGFTFALQFMGQEKRGRDFCGRFAWRLLFLGIFAMMNAAFFPGGDILLSFCITGLVLIPARKWRLWAIGLFAVFFLLQPLEIYHYVNGFFKWGGPTFSLDGYWGYGAMDKTTRAGEFFPMIWNNITAGEIASISFLFNTGRMVQTAGLFLLGLLIGKGKFFADTEENRTFWTKGVLLGGFLSLFFFVLNKGGKLPGPVAHIVSMWYNTAMTVAVMSFFLLMYRGEYFRKVTAFLCPYGRMSLTMYVSQSFLASIILFPYALGLGSQLNRLQTGMICLGLIAIQMVFCRIWFKYFRYGPLEYLWHKATWIYSDRR